ncbi:Glycosyltransferase, GT2 family [Caballeronia arationis]|uniref:Glycosyltransferase, GT2 family n=1 Tax=Caballeronia arationis TaxID=1777142 RepID=A0A7Z7I8D8_9BURK|nr:glycosyltransferase family 2 protein [Caballeronia arationis]SOE80812.1 Glycosyltransferase, GT2 family [Caballeronia arationis]
MKTDLGPKPELAEHELSQDERTTLVNLRAQVDTANTRIANLEAELTKAKAEVRASSTLQARLARANADVRALRNSTSWRVTAPLRSASRVVVVLRLALQSVRLQSQARGGLGNVFRHYTAILRKEGWQGIRRRVQRVSNAGVGDANLNDGSYDAWIEQYDSLTSERLAHARDLMSAFELTPLISVIVPAYNSDEQFLTDMIQSVKDQLYPNWELCIADDHSSAPQVRTVLEREMARDSRIKVVFREQNGHISESSNSALAIAQGEYIALLDHDDLLPRHALMMVVRYINRHPDASMFYSDEDKLTPYGQRVSPYFKSDWNPELFLTQNMFSHLGVFRSAIVRAVGGFRRGFEGSQDHDLALRCAEIAGADKIVHIPHVLYHWRISPGSTAGSGSEKPYAVIAGVKAVEEHFSRTRVNAVVEQSFDQLSLLRVRYAVPVPAPLVSILIPTRDGVDLLRQCIGSVIAKTSYTQYEIIVIDNGSEKPETLAYFEHIKDASNIRVLRDDSPFNFSALNNHAAVKAKGEYLCLLNNDIEVITPDWLEEMVGIASQPGNGAVGAALWYPNDTLQHGGVLIGLGGVAGHMHSNLIRGHFGYFGRAAVTQNLSAVTAACLVIRKSIYDEVGGLDERLAVAFNDVDFCLRVRDAGYRNVWTPHAELYHHESATRGSDMLPEKYERFVKEVRWMEAQWGEALSFDPAYNPNLDTNTAVAPFSLAHPPRIDMLD